MCDVIHVWSKQVKYTRSHHDVHVYVFVSDTGQNINGNWMRRNLQSPNYSTSEERTAHYFLHISKKCGENDMYNCFGTLVEIENNREKMKEW